MKKTFLVLIVFLSLCGIASAAAPGDLSYTPLEPLPGTTAGGQTVTSLPTLLSALFKLLITFGSLFAVVMLVVAGIGYMISEAAVDIEKAKERARAALWGLLLLTACWLILYTVNPDLLKFNLNIPGVSSSVSPNSANKTAGNSASTNNTLTDAELQELRKTYTGGTAVIDMTSGQAANDQEAEFRRKCEDRGGSAEALGSDGYRSTYGCQIPNYMP